jgi:hypothetical protein
MALIKDTELVLESKDTFKKMGGNIVESLLNIEIKKNLRFQPSKNALRKAIQTGYIEQGNNMHDISELLINAKSNFSQRLLASVKTYFERIAIDMQELKGILIVGGGALASEYKGKITTPPMSQLFMNYFHELAPYCGELDTRDLNLRMLNFEGMKFLYKYFLNGQ